VWTWETAKGTVAGVVAGGAGAVVVLSVGAFVVLEPVDATVDVVDLAPEPLSLPQAASINPAATMASTTVPDRRRRRVRS
jgi:hypothetical protein